MLPIEDGYSPDQEKSDKESVPSIELEEYNVLSPKSPNTLKKPNLLNKQQQNKISKKILIKSPKNSEESHNKENTSPLILSPKPKQKQDIVTSKELSIIKERSNENTPIKEKSTDELLDKIFEQDIESDIYAVNNKNIEPVKKTITEEEEKYPINNDKKSAIISMNSLISSNSSTNKENSDKVALMKRLNKGLSYQQQKKILFRSTRHGRYKDVRNMLEKGFDPNTIDVNGNTILLVAAQNGNKKMVKTALRFNGNINHQNLKGNTALHYCFAYGYSALGEYLLSKGANDKLMNQYGYTCYKGLNDDKLSKYQRNNLE